MFLTKYNVSENMRMVCDKRLEFLAWSVEVRTVQDQDWIITRRMEAHTLNTDEEKLPQPVKVRRRTLRRALSTRELWNGTQSTPNSRFLCILVAFCTRRPKTYLPNFSVGKHRSQTSNCIFDEIDNRNTKKKEWDLLVSLRLSVFSFSPRLLVQMIQETTVLMMITHISRVRVKMRSTSSIELQNRLRNLQQRLQNFQLLHQVVRRHCQNWSNITSCTDLNVLVWKRQTLT